jgi:hypothetical protein
LDFGQAVSGVRLPWVPAWNPSRRPGSRPWSQGIGWLVNHSATRIEAATHATKNPDQASLAVSLGLGATLAHAGLLVTRDAAATAAFQQGLTVLDFECETPLGRRPQALTTPGVAVHPHASLFDQAPGVKFSAGGSVGVNRPAIYALCGAAANDAASGSHVLGTVDFEGNTNFGPGAFLEVLFRTPVSRVGFWVNQQLDFVTLIALNTNFAFSGLEEVILETGIGNDGFFVGNERSSADIGGFKIPARGNEGFTIDDFRHGGAVPVPEPGSLTLLLAGVGVLWARSQARATGSFAAGVGCPSSVARA